MRRIGASLGTFENANQSLWVVYFSQCSREVFDAVNIIPHFRDLARLCDVVRPGSEREQFSTELQQHPG
jgi:hypothetical protein